jgi:hypothetical protein
MRILVPTIFFLFGLSLASTAYKEGPFPNMTGGFGDKTCHSCHFDNPVNAPGGTLTVTGVPSNYAAGETYPITVTIARDGMARGGFEIAARFASGREKARQAGAWRPLDQRVKLIASQIDPSLTFVQHTLIGSRVVKPGVNTWTIEWTAPAASAGPVQFNVAGNTSNDDDSALGDFIYLKTLRSRPR